MLFLKNLLFIGFAALVCSFISSCATSSDISKTAVYQNVEFIRADFKGKSREDIGQIRLDEMLFYECHRNSIDENNKLHHVKARYEVVELLVQKGAYPDRNSGTCNGILNLKFVKLLQENGIDWNKTSKLGDADYKALLAEACRNYDGETLAYIRANGGVFNKNEKWFGNHCMFNAAGGLNQSAIAYLLSIGFDPNKTLGNGKNKSNVIHSLAISLALSNKSLNHPAMHTLLKAGADPNSRNLEGLTVTESYNAFRKHLVKVQKDRENSERYYAQRNQEIEQLPIALFKGVVAGAEEYNRIQGQKNSTGVKSYGDGVTPSKVLYGQNNRLPGTSNQKLQKSAGLTGQVNHTCRSGTKVNVPVSAKTSACLEAKKFMAITYACNRIDDFKTLKTRCTSACGRQDCAETGG